MKFSHRIFYYFLKDEVLFSRILEYVKKDIDAIDEIALIFDETCSFYRTAEKLEEEADVCKRRIKQLRDAGVKSVGINVLATIGQGEEAWSWLPMPPFGTAVDPFGRISFGQMCPRDEQALEYIRLKYRTVIKTDPDFIWVDDDMRVPYHQGANCACFCDRCVERFNKIAGTAYRRNTLVNALNNPNNAELRRKWLQYNLDSYANINAIVRDEVEKSSKEIKLGLMSVHIPQNTKMLCDLKLLVDSLGANMFRPGGGFYEDNTFTVMIDKICGTAYQNSVMHSIPERMYEMEDFPATVPRKSVRTHITESVLAIMAGCDGIMTNSMPPCRGTSNIYKAFAKERECFETIANCMRNTNLIGARPAFSPDFDVHIHSDNWFSCCITIGEEGEGIFAKETVFSNSGFLPYTNPNDENAWITFLSGEMARAMSDEYVKTVLSRAVLMDGMAAEILYQRGYGDLIGCVPGKQYDNGLAEFYTSHPLNGEAALERRDTRMTFKNNKCVAMCLEPLDGAEILSNMVSITGEKLGVASIAFENKLGGRCVVMGYDPWRFPNMWHRKIQMHGIFDWLWNGHAPYTGIKATEVFQLYRESTDRKKFMLMLTNTWEDSTEPITVCLSNIFEGDIYAYNGGGVFEKISEDRIRVENDKQIISLPQLESHRFILIMNQ